MFITVLLLMFVLFLSMISIIFDFTGSFLIFEIMLTILFLVIALILIHSLNANKRWVWPAMLVFFSANLINQIALYRLVGLSRIILPFAVTALGFVIALSKSRPDEEEFVEEEPVVESHEPGKYVASKTGKKFHVPECGQAKRIKKDRQICFDSEKEAKKEGKTACKCVKK